MKAWTRENEEGAMKEITEADYLDFATDKIEGRG